MRCLIACKERLFLLNTSTRRLEVLEDHRPSYYGISWPADGLDLCLSHSGLDNSKLLTGKDYLDSERGWLSAGPRSGPPFLSAPHQILCDGDLIIATNSGRNCISLVRRQDFFYLNHWLDSQYWDRGLSGEPAGSHFNSLFRHQDKLYVLAHNFERGAYVLTLAWPTLQILHRKPLQALGAHNFWIDPSGTPFTCDSMRSAVVNAGTQQVVWQSGRSDILTRAAAATGSTLLIGSSLITRRQARNTADGGVFIIDTNTWKTQDFIEIPAGGALHEIRLIDLPDYCHHSHPYRGPLIPNPPAQQRYESTIIERKKHRDLRLARIEGWAIECGDPLRATPSQIELAPASFTLLTSDRGQFSNVRLSAHITLPAHNEPQHAGLITHYQGPGDQNMYVALLYRDGPLLRADLWRNHQGQWSTLATAPITPADTPLPLEFTILHNRLTLSVAGSTLLTTLDDQPLPPGLVGIRATAGTFSNLSIEPLPPTTP